MRFHSYCQQLTFSCKVNTQVHLLVNLKPFHTSDLREFEGLVDELAADLARFFPVCCALASAVDSCRCPSPCCGCSPTCCSSASSSWISSSSSILIGLHGLDMVPAKHQSESAMVTKQEKSSDQINAQGRS